MVSVKMVNRQDCSRDQKCLGLSSGIRHFHISHNAPYLPPPPKKKKKLRNPFFFFHFPWVLRSSQEQLKTKFMQNVWGIIRCIVGKVEVAYS